MVEVGDRVRVIGGGLYLGKWLLVGTQGKVVADRGVTDFGRLYQVEISGKVYNLAPAEFEVIPSDGMEHSIVTDDDGYIG